MLDVITHLGPHDLSAHRGIGTPPASAPRTATALPTARRVIDVRDASIRHQDVDADLLRYRTAQLLDSGADILAARRLNAEIYLASGFISAEDIDPDGTINDRIDPWVEASTYFGVVRDGLVRATSRQIRTDAASDLPALHLAGLSADELDRISRLPAGAAVEISGLARNRRATGADVIAVYVRMWQESLARRHQVWVMAVDLPVFKQLQGLLCGDAIRQIGPLQEYVGSIVVPAVIWCDQLNPEQRRMAALASAGNTFRSLVPRLFPHPAGAVR